MALPAASSCSSLKSNGSGRVDHLEFIRRAGQTTRRAITEHTGLSRSVVAQSISELIAQGLVVECAPVKRAATVSGTSRGRPTAVLQLARQRGVVVAADIGHNHITVAVADLQSQVLTERRIEFAVDSGAAAAFAAVRELVSASRAEVGFTPADLRGFGVSFPFPVAKGALHATQSVPGATMPRGTVNAPAQLGGWQSVDVSDVCPPGLTCPFVYDNDANFGAWGERMHGAARGINDLLYVKVGHGIGSGLIVNGSLLTGARGIGGEMGHIQVDPSGRICRCGRRGCLETVVADSLPDYHEAGLHVGRAIAKLCAFLDPEAVVLGGQIGVVGEPLLAGVSEAFAEFDLMPGTPLVAPQLGAPETTKPQEGVPVLCAALGGRSEVVGIIDRTLMAAWASPDIGWHPTSLTA